MSVDVGSFAELVTLEPHGPDTFVGISPSYPWGRVYGGQVVAQALRAAAATVTEELPVHSLHAYFIRGGDVDEPIRFEVDRIRNGRSFVTRRVVARQSGGAILNLSASFHAHEDEPTARPTTLDPGTPGPDSTTDNSWGPLLDRREIGAGTGGARTWLRVKGPLADDPIVHQCALAYASDDAPMEAVVALHPSAPTSEEDFQRFMSASLDHAVWFHHPVRGDAWHLYDQWSDGLAGARGLSMGRVFTEDGALVASIAQEVLLRDARP